MKKLLAAVMIVVVPTLISTGAWALTVVDTEASGTYYAGGTYHDSTGTPTYTHDVNPFVGDNNWSVTSLTGTNIAGGYIMVTLTGPYFGNLYATQATVGASGDLYISSTGWQTSSGSAADHWASDKFDPATEGWNLVVPFGGTKIGPSNTLVFAYTNTMHDLGVG
jgi:hypothetical protein